MRRWIMLALGTAAQTAACVFVYGIPYLAPQLRAADRLTLAQVGLLVASPTLGLVLALVAWGAAADRWGERSVIAAGLAGAAALLAAATAVPGTGPLGVLLTAAGMSAASVYAASGRLVMGWFSAAERGLAMGIRQTSTPLGMGLAALTVPPAAAGHGLTGALVLMTAVCAAMAVLVAAFAADPARPAKPAGAPRSANPYRSSRTLWRIHGSGALLVVPQFAVGAFALVLLVDLRHEGAVPAGRLVAGGQVLGALLRIAAGVWSDRTGSRMRPMRRLAVLTAAVVGAVAAGAAFPSPFTDAALILAIGVTASTNGLSFTATAEAAGPSWSGRALGIHNTGQNLVASLTPPLLGALITAFGYWPAFASAAALSALAAAVVPVGAEQPGRQPVRPWPARTRARKLAP